jgi:predicted FMN-binding regulatory protein PaiB
MYCPKTYAVPTAEDGGLSDVMQECIAENPLAMIVWATETGTTADHIPLLYNKVWTHTHTHCIIYSGATFFDALKQSSLLRRHD